MICCYQTLYLLFFLHKCTFGLNFSPHEILHIWRRFLHHTHAICGEFQISPHLSCGDIWNFSTCGEIFNFPTIVIHGKLKFLHMKIFSPLIILVILVTNMRFACGWNIVNTDKEPVGEVVEEEWQGQTGEAIRQAHQAFWQIIQNQRLFMTNICYRT